MSYLDPLAKLKDLFRVETEKRGGKVAAFHIDPTEPPELSVVLDLEDDLFLDEEQKQEKDQFAEFERMFHEDQKDDQAIAAVTRLAGLSERLLDSNQGILDEEEE